MSLLPKSSKEFSSRNYWDAFFTKRKDDPFEWYGEYRELSSLLKKYTNPKDDLLVVGCGNSTLSKDLYDAGIKKQTSIDISPVVVQQMKTTYPELKFLECDVTKMPFDDDSFSCVLDKGTFDALAPPPDNSRKSRNKTEIHSPDDYAKVEEKVNLMLTEVKRVLKFGGRFICISLLQPHIASKLLQFFHENGWFIRVLRCTEAEAATEAKSEHQNSVIFPVFMTVFTKMKSVSGKISILEAANSDVGPILRFPSLDDLISHIKEQQNFALVKKGFKDLGFCAESGVCLTLNDPVSSVDRFIIHVVDVPRLLKNPVDKRFGVFVVPQGRESEWMFGTHEGRMSLAADIKFTRLAVVHLVRGQKYESLNAIQEELRLPLASLAPKSVADANIQAPIMTTANDLGERTIVYEGKSEFSGDFVVEDVVCDGKTLRRLIFLNAPNIIQSEVAISTGQGKKPVKFPNQMCLECHHHAVMTLSFPFLNLLTSKSLDNKAESKTYPVSCLLIGLGGGLLASFLVNFMSHLKVTVVEIDQEIQKIAHQYFGLPTSNENLTVFIDDGLKFIQSTGTFIKQLPNYSGFMCLKYNGFDYCKIESQYNIILIDVDNKSTGKGLSCPPEDFLALTALMDFKSRLCDNGIFVLNLCCRNEELKKTYLQRINEVFPHIILCEIDVDVNTVLFCFSSKFTLIKTELKSVVCKAISTLRDSFKSKSKSNKCSNFKDNSQNTIFNELDSLIQNFKILSIPRIVS